MNKKKTIMHIIFDYAWSLFLNGLFTILPLVITLALCNITLKFLTSWLEPIRAWQPHFFTWLPFSEIILAIILIVLLGTVLKLFVFRSIVHGLEHMLNRVPFIRSLYNSIKQLVSAFGPHDKYTFKQVVMLEFPHTNIYSIGFLTSELTPELAPNQSQEFINVFVPTTPNPTSGFYIILPKSQVIFTQLTRQEAMALIMSGGIIQPDRLKNNTPS